MERLGGDVWRLLLSYLDIDDLYVCMQVNKAWYNYATEDKLWKHLLLRDFSYPIPPTYTKNTPPEDEHNSELEDERTDAAENPHNNPTGTESPSHSKHPPLTALRKLGRKLFNRSNNKTNNNNRESNNNNTPQNNN